MAQPKLAICAIFKNEAPYLLEWIAYHVAVGFEHFVLYDNDSTDNGAALVRGSPLADKVTVIHWPQRPGQLSAYRHFIDIFAPGFDWAAFIDLDEFMLPLNSRSVVDTLERLNTASAVLVHWLVFGPGDWTQRPDGLVIENYDRRAPDEFDMNRHVKSLVRCADVLDVTQNPHEFLVRGLVCNTAGHPVPNVALQATACHAELVINHYHTKSRQDWQAKIERGSAMFDYTHPKYDAALIDHFAAVCQVQDRTIQAFAPAVRALLGGGLPPEIGMPAAPQPAAAPPVIPTPPRPIQAAPGWVWSGQNAQEHVAALVYRDQSRSGWPWVAALRGSARSMIDPEFLEDDQGRIRAFQTDDAARAACEAALAAAGR